MINGQKIWGGDIDTADYSFLLARTNANAPKHRGISFFVIPAKTPGIRFEKIENLGGHVQNIVYYDDVRVPVQESLIGAENEGWYVATAALNLERTMIEHAANAKLMLGDLVALLREHGSVSPVTRHKLASVAIEAEVARMLSFRIGWLQSREDDISYAASQIKVFGSEMSQRNARLGRRGARPVCSGFRARRVAASSRRRQSRARPAPDHRPHPRGRLRARSSATLSRAAALACHGRSGLLSCAALEGDSLHVQ